MDLLSPSLSKRDLKLACNVNIVYGNLKSENSQVCIETSTKLYVHEFGFWFVIVNIVYGNSSPRTLKIMSRNFDELSNCSFMNSASGNFVLSTFTRHYTFTILVSLHPVYLNCINRCIPVNNKSKCMLIKRTVRVIEDL